MGGVAQSAAVRSARRAVDGSGHARGIRARRRRVDAGEDRGVDSCRVHIDDRGGDERDHRRASTRRCETASRGRRRCRDRATTTPAVLPRGRSEYASGRSRLHRCHHRSIREACRGRPHARRSWSPPIHRSACRTNRERSRMQPADTPCRRCRWSIVSGMVCRRSHRIIRVDDPRYAIAWNQTPDGDSVMDEQRVDRAIRLEPATQIRVKVVDEAAKPIAGAGCRGTPRASGPIHVSDHRGLWLSRSARQTARDQDRRARHRDDPRMPKNTQAHLVISHPDSRQIQHSRQVSRHERSDPTGRRQPFVATLAPARSIQLDLGIRRHAQQLAAVRALTGEGPAQHEQFRTRQFR